MIQFLASIEFINHTSYGHARPQRIHLSGCSSHPLPDDLLQPLVDMAPWLHQPEPVLPHFQARIPV
jgi:hypothetical protein